MAEYEVKEPEEPEVKYEYTVPKEFMPTRDGKGHEILHKIKEKLPEISHKIPSIAKKFEHFALGLGSGILGTEETVAKMKLAQIETKEKIGAELTPEEKMRKERLTGFIGRVEAMKKALEEKKREAEKKAEEVV